MCECVRDTLGDYKAQLSEHHLLFLLRCSLCSLQALAIGLPNGVLINGRSDIRGKISWHFVREGSVSLPPGIMNDMNVTKSY